MKKYLISLFALFLVAGAFAQEIGNFMGREPIISPEIGEKNVTFRFLAPYADSVAVTGGFAPTVKMKTSFGEMDVPSNIKMTKNEKGLWSVTVPLPEPELYTYNFIVDGLSVNDPNNIFMQRDGTRYLSVLLVPGKVTENYFEAKQRGNLNQVWYDSPTLGMQRRLFVYTPYGYADSKEKYPVLYLLHGAGGDEDAWSTMGRACQILDNLIEKGLAKPMICVMPNGNPGQQAAKTQLLDEKTYDRNDPNFANLYVKSIVNDIVPYIESHYRAIPKREARAVSGLSMGGGHTLAVTSLFPGTFDYILPLSMGVRGDAETVDKQLLPVKQGGYKLYWIGCGETDFVWEMAKNLDAAKPAMAWNIRFMLPMAVTPGPTGGNT